jgi:integrase
VALYLAHLADAGRKPAGIDRVLSALAKAHQLAGYPGLRKHGAIAEVRAGIRRTLGTDQVRKAPLLVDALKKITKKLRAGLFGARDRALLLTGFAGAFRRSELVALDVADLVWVPEGLTILVRRSKTDQEGKGRTVPIPRGRYEATCPVRAMRAWLEAAGIAAGAIFQGLTRGGRLTGKRLADRDVARLVKRAVGSTGLDSQFFSGHSLRAGLVTQAAREGKSDRKIMDQTGHRSRAMLDRYVREAELFVDNAASGLGL